MCPNQEEVDQAIKEAYAVAHMMHEEQSLYAQRFGTGEKTKTITGFARHCFGPDLKEFAIIYWPNDSQLQRVERFDPPRVWAKTYLLNNLHFTKKPDDWDKRVFEFVDVERVTTYLR